MPQTHAFWEDSSNMQHIKYESSNSNDDHPRLKDDKTMYSYCDGNLNFATGPCSEDESEYGSLHYKKNKVSRQDPLSHRIIEKRRRDRMNNCLADLSRLIPTEYLKKGRGRIEKTEIIEMAIQYMKHLQQLHASPTEHYRLGYQDCTSEAMRFLIEIEGHYPREPLCVRFLGHLQKHFETRSRSPIKETAAPEIFKPLQPQDYSHKSKDELNNNDLENMHEDYIACSRNCTENNIDRHADNNGSASYKYKTNIKLRFTQDTSAAKRPIVDENDDDMQQTSGTSIENLSSSNGSPAINYDLQRTTENMSPGNFIPRAYHFKIDLPRKHSRYPTVFNYYKRIG